MYSEKQGNDISFFGIGGIHGLPYVQWDGSGGTKPVPKSEWGGYCHHGSTLFPTWHRPYVGLFEVYLCLFLLQGIIYTDCRDSKSCSNML